MSESDTTPARDRRQRPSEMDYPELARRLSLRTATAGPDDCHVWTGTTTDKGYGRILLRRYQVLTHRLAWILANGPIPPGMCVCHRCDNPPCCNPRHLFLGTKSENAHDMMAKNRQARGVRRGNAKFTDERVAEVRRLHATGLYSVRSLARKFKMSHSYAVRGLTWQHVA